MSDINSRSEAHTIKLFLSLFPVVALLACFVNVKYKTTENRKACMIMGMLIISLTWLSMGISYSYDSYVLPKYAIFIISLVMACTLDSCFFSMVNDIGSSGIVSYSIGFSSIDNFLTVFIMRLLISHRENYRWFCFGASGICLVNVIIMMIY